MRVNDRVSRWVPINIQPTPWYLKLHGTIYHLLIANYYGEKVGKGWSVRTKGAIVKDNKTCKVRHEWCSISDKTLLTSFGAKSLVIDIRMR